jgi:NAD(P)H-dependent flavin oxidoreductase YrpB (nitropropane dioxygenase family)
MGESETLFCTDTSANSCVEVGLPALASAVSNAGGLGILTALSQPSPDALRTAIRETRNLTGKYPFLACEYRSVHI